MASVESTQRHCPSCGAIYPSDYAVCPRDTTPLVRGEAPEDPLIGTVLGDTYEIARLIGEGGMGRVYEARQVRLGKRFAVKVLHQMLAADRDALARFRREATAAVAIVSPYVAEVVDVHATRDGRPYLVYELLEGEDLGVLLERDGTLSITRAARIARQVASGLGAAHAAGVVHRDLKPENIMLLKGNNGEDRVKVLDFGIAKVTAEDKLTRTGAVLGTPAYMAPEQARGTGLDHRCDIYALGAILYRAVTGRAAFGGTDVGRTLTSVIWDEPERPKTLRKELPDAFELLIQRAMAKDPDGRFASMAELDAALAPFDASAGRTMQLAGRPAGDVGRAETVALPAGVVTPPPPNHTTARRGPPTEVRARWARPRAVTAGSVVAGWIVILVGSLLGWAISGATHHALGPVERVLVVALAVALTAPLAALEIRRLVRGAWRNTNTMLGRADALTSVAFSSLAAYALIAGPGRFWGLLRHADPPVLTELAALFVAVAVAGVLIWRTRR
jgi:serine/threonine-protein kinase